MNGRVNRDRPENLADDRDDDDNSDYVDNNPDQAPESDLPQNANPPKDDEAPE